MSAERRTACPHGGQRAREFAELAQARGLLMSACMLIETIDHAAAIAAAKTAFDVVQKTTWPTEIAKPAKQCARDMLASITESIGHDAMSASRRRCLRSALLNAIELAAICDIARAHLLGGDESLPLASKALSLIGMTYHATSIANE